MYSLFQWLNTRLVTWDMFVTILLRRLRMERMHRILFSGGGGRTVMDVMISQNFPENAYSVLS